MSKYEVWVIESRHPDDIESPWDIEQVYYGFDAEKDSANRLARENGRAPRSLMPRRWRNRRYVPEVAK